MLIAIDSSGRYTVWYMSLIISIALLLVGLFLVTYGSDWLVDGASSFSLKAGIKPLVIGLTIVAFGTSMPELVVSITAALNGNPDIAVGNVVGSNIANILLILGVSTWFSSIKVQPSSRKKELPLLLFASLLLLALSLDAVFNLGVINNFSRLDGVILLIVFGFFLRYVYTMMKNSKVSATEASETEKIPLYSNAKSFTLIFMGLVGLVAGGKLFVTNAVDLARAAGLSELLIGLTIVSIGTSLPELATSINASRKGHSDLVIGNILGSNIFNILWIVGVTSLIQPIPISGNVLVDMAISIIVSALLLVLIRINKEKIITKKAGIVMVSSYVAYIIFIYMRG